MFTLRVKNSGNPIPTLYEGDYDKVMTLAHALQSFPSDVVMIEVWDCDTMDTMYKWESPDWV